MLGSFWGSMALLMTALIVIRILPGGISSLGDGSSSGARDDSEGDSRCSASLHRAFSVRMISAAPSRPGSCMALVVAASLVYPAVASSFAATNVAYYLLNIPMAFGLSLLWGYGGVLSFGQVAFFAVAGYVYGIVAGNFPGCGLGDLGGQPSRARGGGGAGGRLRVFHLLRPGRGLDRARS